MGDGRGRGKAPLQSNDSTQALKRAVDLYLAGRLAEGEVICRQILQCVPQHDETLYLLGLISYETGKNDIVVELINEAIVSDPSKPDYYNLLGNALNHLGKLDEALASYNLSISLNPDDAKTYNYLGNIHNQQGNQDAAVASYQKALSLKPDYAVARYNLGNTLLSQRKWLEAIASFKKTLLFTSEQSETQLRAATYLSLGHALQGQGNCIDAVTNLKKALSLRPDYLDAYNSLGNVFLEIEKIEEAIASYSKAIALKPDDTTSIGNMGMAYMSYAKPDEAADCYSHALLLEPDRPELHNNYLTCIQYSPAYTPPTILNAHRAFAEQFEAPQRCSWPLHEHFREPKRCLKVGFVSGDFCTHPVGFFIEALLVHLNRNALEVVLYYNSTLTDEVTLRLMDLGYHWRSLVDITDNHAAQMVQDDGIDILIDLSGHTANNRLQLFARKPAPVQVTWLGYFSTTGLQAMDYILGDPYVLPPDEADHFSETPWRLPESYLCFTPPQYDVKIGELPATRNGFITFGCFNNLSKLNGAVLDLWAKVLNAVPNSRLFLKTKQLSDHSVETVMRQRFSAYGITSERLILEGFSPRPELLAAYNRVDIVLDPFPFPGGTTSVEGLWMGVPFITLRGDRFLAHIGESIAYNAGLADWIATNDEDYVVKAVMKSSDLERLTNLRRQLRQQVLSSPLFDGPRFARHFEEALWGMWNEWTSKREGIQ